MCIASACCGSATWQRLEPVDTTLVSPLTRAGEPRRRAGRFAGATLTDARKAKERAYPELLHNSRCRLVVLGIEVGGRWSEEAASFITSLARTKTRDTPAPLRHAATTSLISRWKTFLTHAAMTAFAASLLFEDPTHHHNFDGKSHPSVTSSQNSLQTRQTPADYPHILPDSLMHFALDFAHLETGQYKTVPLLGSWPVKQLPETLSRQKGVKKKMEPAEIWSAKYFSEYS